jgi:Borrelia P83/100 protein.
MVKKVMLSLLLCAATGFLFAAEAKEAQIDTSILDKAYAETYINDTSVISWKHYSTGKQIRDMGRRLGAEIKYQEQVNHADSPYAGGSPDFKYKAVRIYPGTKDGADVIYVEKHATVNTIQNMRRIVSGYIERAYDIPMVKADEIAKKVCYWNTNHYNDKEYFKANFQVRVREVFSNKTSIIGLARSYKNWPGKTRIVIPFVLIKESVPDAVQPAPQPAVTEPEAAPAPEVEAPAPEPETEEPAPAQPEVTQKKAGLPALTIILIIILVIALIVLAAVLVKRAMDKKKEEENGVN